jgi:hypothetical protein
MKFIHLDTVYYLVIIDGIIDTAIFVTLFHSV